MSATGVLYGVASGAFTEGQLRGYQPQSTAANAYNVAFSAHNSNSVYTDNGNIYPASIALNFIIKT